MNASERTKAQPANAFDDVDFDHDGYVSRSEAQRQVNGRLYREIGIAAFFVLLDTDGNDELSPAEIQAAHDNGQLANE